jgi:glycosyltransferase involved in cell wall biosynthesis
VPPKLYGGIERIVADLAKALVKQGWELGLVASKGSQVDGVKVFPWAVDRPYGPGCHLANAITLLKAWKQFRPDVVHSFSRLIYLWPILWGGGKAVMTYQRATGGWNLFLARIFGRARLQFTGISEYISAQGKKRGGNWNVVPNFVDTAKYSFVPEVPSDAPLLFLSRVDSDKGPGLAIQIARTAGRKLILAGNKPVLPHEIKYWNEKVEPEIGNGVEYVGAVDDRQKNELLGKAAALLVPVQWDEPFGIVFAEALACGTPVISCPRGALPEIVDEGKDGFLIRNEAEGIKAVQKIKTIKRKACRMKAEQKFSVSAVAPQYEKIYREISKK